MVSEDAENVTVLTGDYKTIVEGKLLGFGDGGDFEIQTEDGFIHYCWPMLDVTLIEDKIVFFKKKFPLLTCMCGAFEIDISDLDIPSGELTQRIYAHAKTHHPTSQTISTSIVDEF
jgi:hypothetical protein